MCVDGVCGHRCTGSHVSRPKNDGIGGQVSRKLGTATLGGGSGCAGATRKGFGPHAVTSNEQVSIIASSGKAGLVVTFGPFSMGAVSGFDGGFCGQCEAGGFDLRGGDSAAIFGAPGDLHGGLGLGAVPTPPQPAREAQGRDQSALQGVAAHHVQRGCSGLSGEAESAEND